MVTDTASPAGGGESSSSQLVVRSPSGPPLEKKLRRRRKEKDCDEDSRASRETAPKALDLEPCVPSGMGADMDVDDAAVASLAVRDRGSVPVMEVDGEHVALEVGVADENAAALRLERFFGLSEPQLRKRCKEAGLSTTGSRGRLVKFHV